MFYRVLTTLLVFNFKILKYCRRFKKMVTILVLKIMSCAVGPSKLVSAFTVLCIKYCGLKPRKNDWTNLFVFVKLDATSFCQFDFRPKRDRLQISFSCDRLSWNSLEWIPYQVRCLKRTEWIHSSRLDRNRREWNRVWFRWNYVVSIYRSSRCVMKMFWKSSQSSHENTCIRISSLIKLLVGAFLRKC